MKVLIVGSGLIGVTAAYFLRRSGHAVTVIEREGGPGRGTSFANGAMLTPSMSSPWNSPGVWRQLLSAIGGSDAGIRVALRSLPSLARWGIEFLHSSNPREFERNTLSNVRLGLHSLKVMKALRNQSGIEYSGTARGSLRTFRNNAALDLALSTARQLSPEGVHFRRLSASETVELEPALAPIANQLRGAIHYETDETGDAHRFCVALAAYARLQGVEFQFGTELRSLEARSRRIVAAMTNRERITADHFVIAAGSYSAPILRRAGMYLPVRPAKGYSITFDRPKNENGLRIPVVDDDLHAAVVPLDDAVRVAGMVEFAGFDLTLSESRIRKLLELLKKVLPQMKVSVAMGRPWCGLRPMSADGVPIIGPTPIENLWVSTGHGHLGWTLAAASGQLLSDLIATKSPSIDPAPYEFARFGRPASV